MFFDIGRELHSFITTRSSILHYLSHRWLACKYISLCLCSTRDKLHGQWSFDNIFYCKTVNFCTYMSGLHDNTTAFLFSNVHIMSCLCIYCYQGARSTDMYILHKRCRCLCCYYVISCSACKVVIFLSYSTEETHVMSVWLYEGCANRL